MSLAFKYRCDDGQEREYTVLGETDTLFDHICEVMGDRSVTIPIDRPGFPDDVIMPFEASRITSVLECPWHDDPDWDFRTAPEPRRYPDPRRA